MEAKPGFEKSIETTNAAVVIGDRTFDLNGKFLYEFDLAEEWKKFTGLPFVFAAWLSTEKLPADFIKEFNLVLKEGIDHIEQAVNEQVDQLPLSPADTIHYLKNRIDYLLDEKKREGLKLFLGYIHLL